MKQKRICLIAVWLFSASALHAQEFSMDWFGLAGGGGGSLGGDVQLSATIGQPEIGEMTGGDFNIVAGFWSVVTVMEEPGQPSLNVVLGVDSVIVSWPESASDGFALEEAGALGASWVPVNATPQVVNGTNTVRLLLAPGNHFYRLHKP